MRKNIIITGGGLTNKGAQAMTFIAVNELKERFPEHQVYVLSPTDLQRPQSELEKYNFRFMGWYPQKFAKCQKNPILRFITMLLNKNELLEAESIYKNTDLMVDISGYALGSNWPEKICNDYLDNFQFADSFNIPVYLLPQSFGPFDFNEPGMKKIDERVRRIFPRLKLICAREEEGYKELKEHYGLKNVILAPDLVLNNKSINIESIFKEKYISELPEIMPGSIGIIPNNQNFTVSSKQQVMDLYCDTIKFALKQSRYVYLLYHSSVDKKICKELKNMFATEENVILLEEEFSCLEFNELVQHFDYMVASRFHSIVHAYKNGVPCVTIGWADKYDVLLSQFEQRQYLIDMRKQVDADHVLEAMKHMDANRSVESETIMSHLKKVQEKNIFDNLKL